jgi:hypothetical protein
LIDRLIARLATLEAVEELKNSTILFLGAKKINGVDLDQTINFI